MREEKQPAVYIMSNMKFGAIYVGVTSALWYRVCDHKNGTYEGFSKKYSLHRLVWYEHHQSMDAAILREKQLKKWNRNWKIELIMKMNPEWRDLHDEIDSIGTLRD